MSISYFTLIVAVGDPIHDLNCVGGYPNPVPPNLQRDPHIFSHLWSNTAVHLWQCSQQYCREENFLKDLNELQPNLLSISLNDSTRFIITVYDAILGW